MKKEQQIVADRINYLCKEKGLSYYSLSYKSTVPLSTLLHIMDGSSQNPGIYNVIKICEGLGVTLKEFFNTEEFDALTRSVEK